jgi:hypothetical protein
LIAGKPAPTRGGGGPRVIGDLLIIQQGGDPF